MVKILNAQNNQSITLPKSEDAFGRTSVSKTLRMYLKLPRQFCLLLQGREGPEDVLLEAKQDTIQNVL